MCGDENVVFKCCLNQTKTSRYKLRMKIIKIDVWIGTEQLLLTKEDTPQNLFHVENEKLNFSNLFAWRIHPQDLRITNSRKTTPPLPMGPERPALTGRKWLLSLSQITTSTWDLEHMANNGFVKTGTFLTISHF